MLESPVKQGVLGPIGVGGRWLACFMSSTYAASFDRLEECLDEIGAVDPGYRTTTEKQQALLGLSRVIARAQAERLRILAVGDDVAEATGARTTAAWLATSTRDAHGTTRRDARLAASLDRRWTQLAAAFAAGAVISAQTRVIVEALDALPKNLADDLVAKAEAHLVDEAAHHGPHDLRILGARILSVVAPDVADDHEYQQAKPDASPAKPASGPPSSAASPRSSTSAESQGSSTHPNAPPWRSATRPAPRSTAPCPPPSAKPTIPNPGPAAARPTSRTASCSAPSTTTAPTTPAGSPTTTPTDRPPSPDANRQTTLRHSPH